MSKRALVDKPLVCVVDDDLSVRQSLHNLLRSAGLRAEEFESGPAFLEAGAWERAACIVLDVAMPEMSGPELQTMLQAKGCDVPIIFITAHGDEALKERVLAAGARAFLHKPFDEDDFLGEISLAVGAAV